MTYIGIDISKATFVAAFPHGKGYRIEIFQNDAKGIRGFISKLAPAIHHCVMEATGNYCFLLLYLLDKAGIRASLINPKKIQNYARVMMSVTKTDSKDACLIADFGERFKPEPYVPVGTDNDSEAEENGTASTPEATDSDKEPTLIA